MNWDDLRIFLAVSQLGGVSHAAPRLGLDPATVSRRLKRLEGAMDAALFARASTGLVLTHAGERLRAQAEGMESIAQNLTPGAPEGLHGVVRIGAPDGCANILLPEVCAAIAAENPELTLDIVPVTRSLDLLRREVDIAVTVNEPASKRISALPVAEYELVFAASRRLLDQTGLSGLDGLPLTAYIPELLLDPGLDIPDRYRFSEPTLRSSSAMVQWRWIADGEAAGLLHDFLFPSTPGLVRLEPEFSVARRYFVATRRDEGRVVAGVVEQVQRRLAATLARLRAEAAAIWAKRHP